MEVLKLKIYSSNLDNQINFYLHKIGLELVEKDDCKAIFQIGTSLLEIEKSTESQPYHFAINIPSNKVLEALSWLKERVEVHRFENKEIQDFKSWKSKAIYFYDEDKNIVEFISRKNLAHYDHSHGFDRKSLLNISEIGIAVERIKSVSDPIIKTSKLSVYDGDLKRFYALGDEHGLFICVNKNVKNWFPTDDEAYSSCFKVLFQEKRNKYFLEFKNEEVVFKDYSLYF